MAAAEGQHATSGGSFAYTGEGVAGFGVDSGYAPEFFEPEDDGLDLFISRARVEVTE